MLLSLAFVTLITLGGLALTYLIAKDATLLWRSAVGCVVGSAVFGTIGFAAASLLGLTPLVAAVVFGLILLPLFVFRDKDRKAAFAADRNRAKNLLQGQSFRRIAPFLYYSFFLILFVLFFERAMFIRDGAIMTGASNNLGDLPFHLGAIFSLTEGANFPPENPNFAGAKFTYPFIADLITAYFVKLGADVRDAMLIQNVAWAFSLLIILQRFVFELTREKLAARIAPFLLFFSGGLGFIWFFSDWTAQSEGFFEYLFALPKDYTIGDQFRWGNSLITLFITQRSLLLGMPITIAILTLLYVGFYNEKRTFQAGSEPSKESLLLKIGWAPLVTGAVAGTLVLIHLHSLLVLFVVSVSILLLWRDRTTLTRMLAFGAATSLVAVPELIWSMTGSATQASEFISGHFGWDARENNIFWFWLNNTGLFIPLLIAGIVIALKRKPAVEPDAVVSKKETVKRRKDFSDAVASSQAANRRLLEFFIPFAVIFFVSNLFKFAPWEWDNIKLLIYWWVGSIPFVALFLVYLWKHKNAVLRIAAGLAIAILIFSGALDVFRTVTKQINITVFDNDAVEIGEAIRTRTAPKALVLSAPTYNTAVVLSGRRSLMRYPGHLSSHGIDYRVREDDVRKIYSGGPEADELLAKYDVDQVLFGPEVVSFAADRSRPFTLNEEHFRKYQLLTATAQYRIYKVKQ